MVIRHTILLFIFVDFVLLTVFAFIFYKVPPRWRLEPNDVAVAAGQDVTLQCQADGYPKPIITWKKAVGKYERDP